MIIRSLINIIYLEIKILFIQIENKYLRWKILRLYMGIIKEGNNKD